MELTIHDKYNYYSNEDYKYSIPMGYFEGAEFNNKSAIDQRFCFILIESGSGIIKINNKNMHFIAPVIFCINEKENIIIDKKLNCKVRAIFFHPSVINYTLNFDNIRDIPKDFAGTTMEDLYWNSCFTRREDNYYGKINIGPITYKRFEYLFDEFKKESSLQKKEYWPCRTKSYIMELLFLTEKIYTDNDIATNDVIGEIDDEIYQILIYIINNYNKKITIPILTKEFNINRTTLSERFNSIVGESIISYLNKLRINMASIILKDTILPVSEIMERVGFTDSSHFLRTFKKYFGLSPREYRNKYC